MILMNLVGHKVTASNDVTENIARKTYGKSKVGKNL
jgi:hypothetical protein